MPIKSANSVIESVKELSNWLITDNARETKNRQKLLRNLRVSRKVKRSNLLWFVFWLGSCSAN